MSADYSLVGGLIETVCEYCTDADEIIDGCVAKVKPYVDVLLTTANNNEAFAALAELAKLSKQELDYLCSDLLEDLTRGYVILNHKYEQIIKNHKQRSYAEYFNPKSMFNMIQMMFAITKFSRPITMKYLLTFNKITDTRTIHKLVFKAASTGNMPLLRYFNDEKKINMPNLLLKMNHFIGTTSVDVLKYLFDHGLVINNADIPSYLKNVVRHDNVNVFDHLFTRMVDAPGFYDVSNTYSRYFTMATSNNSVRIVKYLIMSVRVRNLNSYVMANLIDKVADTISSRPHDTNEVLIYWAENMVDAGVLVHNTFIHNINYVFDVINVFIGRGIFITKMRFDELMQTLITKNLIDKFEFVLDNLEKIKPLYLINDWNDAMNSTFDVIFKGPLNTSARLFYDSLIKHSFKYNPAEINVLHHAFNTNRLVTANFLIEQDIIDTKSPEYNCYGMIGYPECIGYAELVFKKWVSKMSQEYAKELFIVLLKNGKSDWIKHLDVPNRDGIAQDIFTYSLEHNDDRIAVQILNCGFECPEVSCKIFEQLHSRHLRNFYYYNENILTRLMKAKKYIHTDCKKCQMDMKYFKYYMEVKKNNAAAVADARVEKLMGKLIGFINGP